MLQTVHLKTVLHHRENYKGMPSCTAKVLVKVTLLGLTNEKEDCSAVEVWKLSRHNFLHLAIKAHQSCALTNTHMHTHSVNPCISLCSYKNSLEGIIPLDGNASTSMN